MYSRPGQHFPFCRETTPTTNANLSLPPLLTTPFPLTVLSCMAPCSPSPATLRMRMMLKSAERSRSGLMYSTEYGRLPQGKWRYRESISSQNLNFDDINIKNDLEKS